MVVLALMKMNLAALRLMPIIMQMMPVVYILLEENILETILTVSCMITGPITN